MFPFSLSLSLRLHSLSRESLCAIPYKPNGIRRNPKAKNFKRESCVVVEMMGDNDGDGEMELDLALSIGGGLRNSQETKPARFTQTTTTTTTTTSGSSLTLFSDGDEESGVTDAKARGEIQAERRREAKRKREEKRQRRARSFASTAQDQKQQRESENQPLKKRKQSEFNVMKNVDLNLSDDQVENLKLQMPYAYSPLQYVPFLNGYAFPCAVPYWATAAGENALHQPVACRSFTPLQTNQNEQSGSSKNRKSGSCGSPVCSSSVISDNYQSSSSHEGGGSSYIRRNSSNASSDEHQVICPNPKPSPSPNDPSNPYGDNRTQCPEKSVESHNSKTSSTTIKKEPISSIKDEVVEPLSKPVFNSVKSSPTMSLKNMNMENGKPPKPQIRTRNITGLQQMPCVSTTGVGPNGKTITGFLYRYSNLEEVSILCVCHGESFSPAEFVKHAGGAEVLHPLRHITVLPTNVIPSAIR